jgi:hypothetical protein
VLVASDFDVLGGAIRRRERESVFGRLLRYLTAGGRCCVHSDHGWVRTGERFLARMNHSLDGSWGTCSPGEE